MKYSMLLILTLSIFFTTTSAAQVLPVRHTNPHYVEVNGIPTEIKFMILSPQSIEKVDVLKTEKAVESYGNKASYGAVIITVKDGTVLLRLPDVYKTFGVADSLKSLRVCVDGLLIKNPSLLVIDKTMIKEIRVSNDHIWIDPMEANIAEQFLNIITSREY